MTERKKNGAANGIDLLPSWQKDIINSQMNGLPGLFVHTAVNTAVSAQRSKFGKSAADTKHAAGKKNKVAARAHYEANKSKYASKTYPNTYAAGDLAVLFPGRCFKTYQNWVSQWSNE